MQHLFKTCIISCVSRIYRIFGKILPVKGIEIESKIAKQERRCKSNFQTKESGKGRVEKGNF